MTKKLPARSRVCEECGREYRIKNSLSRFCSKHCRDINWVRRNPGYMVRAQQRHLLNPEARRRRQERMARYRADPVNKQRAEELQRQRYQANPEPARARVRARREGYQRAHTEAEWQDVLALFGNRCAYCGLSSAELGYPLHKDHVIPISRGDPATVDRIENIVPCCKPCNSRKGNGPAPPLVVEVRISRVLS